MRFWWILGAVGCGGTGTTVQVDSDCVIAFDKCNAGCDLQCMSVAQHEANLEEGTCDLGCPDTGFVETRSCVARDGACVFE